MRTIIFLLVLISWEARTQNLIAEPNDYLKEIKEELKMAWPNNRTINLVFHGHSVPAGYFKTPIVNTLDAYPFQVLKGIKEHYPHAVINIINTSIGGENSVSGAERFDAEVLIHRPDVLFLDYALNDTGIGLERSKEAWHSMIGKVLDQKIKVILLTPSPDQRIDIMETDNVLGQHQKQIRQLAMENGVGLVDSYTLFKEKAVAGDSISKYMSQVNHPNKEGHKLIADEILTYFQQ